MYKMDKNIVDQALIEYSKYNESIVDISADNLWNHYKNDPKVIERFAYTGQIFALRKALYYLPEHDLTDAIKYAAKGGHPATQNYLIGVQDGRVRGNPFTHEHPICMFRNLKTGETCTSRDTREWDGKYYCTYHLGLVKKRLYSDYSFKPTAMSWYQ